MKWSAQLLRAAITIPGLAILLSAAWVGALVSISSPRHPQLRIPGIHMWIYHLDGHCEQFWGESNPYSEVKIDLGFQHTRWRDTETFAVDLGRAAFEAKVKETVLQRRALVALDLGATAREKEVAMADLAVAVSEPSFRQLYRRYRKRNAWITGFDLGYTLNWILMLATPPAALLALAFKMSRDQRVR